MPTDRIVSRVIHIVAKVSGTEEKNITLANNIRKDAGCDSLGWMEMLFWLEDEFGVIVTDEEAAKMQTVEDVVSLVKARVAK